MVSEIEIHHQIDSYLKDENLELYDLNIINFPNISKVEIYIFSNEKINIDTTARLNKQLSRVIEEFGYDTTFPQVMCDGKKLGGTVETVKFLREQKIKRIYIYNII